MITKREFAAAVLYCKGLSGLDKGPAEEYLHACYAELKDLFANADELKQAARNIAANDALFGQYPPLRLWLKYCPKQAAQDAELSSARQKWLELIGVYLTADYFCFLPETTAADISRMGGEIGKIAMTRLDNLDFMRNVAKDNPQIAARFIKQCGDAWDWAIEQISIQNPHNPGLLPENKNLLK